MPVIINGTSGITNVNGSASTPAETGTDTDTGIYYGTNTVGLATNGTSALFIDSSQNVGIGTASPTLTLNVKSPSDYRSALFETASTLGPSVQIKGSRIYELRSTNTGASEGGGLFFIYDKTAETSRITIDSSGNVGIGTSSPATRLNVSYDVAGNTPYLDAGTTVLITNVNATGSAGIKLKSGATAYPSYITYDVNSGSSAALVFYDRGANAERARIDSSGNLLVNGTSTVWGERLLARALDSSTTQPGFGVYSLNSGYTTSLIFAQSETASGTGWQFFNGRSSGGVQRVIIYGNGNIVNSNNSYGALSDIKLKENIVDATPKLAQLNQVRVVNYNLKGEEQKQIGVVAQELEQIFPGMVEEAPDRDAEGNDLGTTTKSVKYSVFVPMLIKAIQEQQALITALTARIEALETK